MRYRPLEEELHYAPEEASRGAFDQLGWELEFGAAHEASDVSFHESLHLSLNRSSAYGSLLEAAATLARSQEDGSSMGRAALAALVTGCRGAHEGFATFGTCARQIGPRHEDAAYDALPDEYKAYFRRWRAPLAPLEAHGSSFLYFGHQALGRWTMQGESIAEALVDEGYPLDPSRIRWRDFPDARLGTARRILDDAFWSEALETVAKYGSRHPDWSALQAAPSDMSIFMKERGVELGRLIFNVFIDAISLRALALDVHTMTGKAALELRERLARRGWSTPTPKPAPPGEVAAASRRSSRREFYAERLVNPRGPSTARVIDLASGDADALIRAAISRGRVWFVARGAASMRRRFDLDDDSLQVLAGSTEAVSMFMIAPGPAGDTVRFVRLPSPRALLTLRVMLGEEREMHVILSASSLLTDSEEWAATWGTMGHVFDHCSIQVDCDPDAVLDDRKAHWTGLSWYAATVGGPEGGVTSRSMIVVARLPDGAPGDVLVLPASGAVIAAFLLQAREMFGEANVIEGGGDPTEWDPLILQRGVAASDQLHRIEPYFELEPLRSFDERH